jgi:hypothetical protein
VNDWVTSAAAANVALPACDAFTVQVPAATGITDDALTVQVLVVVELNTTASPDDAVAVRAVAEAGSVTALKALKVMDCGVFVTTID